MSLRKQTGKIEENKGKGSNGGRLRRRTGDIEENKGRGINEG